MNGEDLRRKAARAALHKWPTVITKVSEQLMPMSQLLDDADRAELKDIYSRFLPSRENPKPQKPSSFVQAMENTEGELRLKVTQEGCVCGMEIHARAIQALPGGFVMAINTAHDPVCPWALKTEGKLEDDPA